MTTSGMSVSQPAPALPGAGAANRFVRPTPLTWVVGAGGLLGTHVTTVLAARGMPSVSSPPVPWNDHEAATATLRAAARHLVESAGEGTWQVFWCAGSGVTGTSRDRFADEQAKLDAVLDALGSATGAGAVFLASSAGGVYAGANAAPYDEFSPVRPLADYGWAKLDAERAVTDWARRTGHRVLIGRIANLYGPGQNLGKPQGLVSQLCAAHLERRPVSIWVSLDTLRDYVYAPDCAELVVDGMDRLRTELSDGAGASSAERVVTKIFGTQRAITIGAVLAELRRIFRRRPSIILGASPASALQARDLSLVSRVWPELDHRSLTTFPAGVAATLADLQLRLQAGASR